ncbi:hypothetical protein Nepgr_003680 [Nepenthes gracilis]|uniref:Uncharacterized protein n=1 Tax=Nepenthes gracilis TaxID=150966 RepID=A0AAD3RZY7_NEPGR|nr:hypothetical protein Nepgr_003680 [Nepenthes gracilis]
MKNRGKELEAYGVNGDGYVDNFSESVLPCKMHPASSSAGICAYCLRDRLVELVCPECGEQRLSSCSCSEISSNPNSWGTAEVASAGRISFLIENEKGEALQSISKAKSQQKVEEDGVVYLKRSNSTCVDVKNRAGFWKIARIFRKKRGKDDSSCKKNDDKSEMWVSDFMGISRSRSLCSFRGGGLYDTEESGGLVVSAARASNVSGGPMMESAKRSCFSESEARISNFDCEKDIALLPIGTTTRNIFSVKESEFSCGEDPGFIDLKLDLSTDPKTELSALKKGGLSGKEFGFACMRGGELLGSEFGRLKGGGSCRVIMSEGELKKRRKSHKVWRWFFRASSKSGKP